ncbi:hypothetical protein GCM10027400_18500 [Pseudoxanthomonas daejeonensis]|uniref:protein O-GlcNAc transferase n=1 Tax=Pseudoxanthomonas daejeonensis TaxID=266062 RepID=A0ABQ6ZB93_9GAMM|nr:hypothetical protein CSC65_00395 [Pseudoxanthomonas daejeonensis]
MVSTTIPASELYARAFAAFRQGQSQQALGMLQLLLRQVPRHADGWNLAGVIHSARQEVAQAAACYRRAVALGAGAGTWVNLGLAEQRRLSHDEAEAAYRKALRMDGTLVIAWQKLGGLLEETGRREEALAAYRSALALEPGNLRSVGDALLLRRYMADWDPASGPHPQDLLAACAHAERSDFAPLLLLALPEADAHVQRSAAARFAATQWGSLSTQPALSAPPAPLPGRRLRVGYLSSDFRAHAVSFLALDAIAAHDRERCEVVLYAHGPPTDDAWRERARSAADRFVEIEADDRSAAQRIAADRLDVLVDLNGYTSQSRMGIVALRPAPVIASWLGYIGTLGDARLADYVIGDAVATPEAMADGFSEALALLPHCFQPNAAHHPVPAMRRDMAGLPEDAVVFCSFNQAYKLHPSLWDDWCAILARVPGSLLWLAPPRDDIARDNLRREAAARGIAPERIVFAPQVPREQHLARLALADVALDTWPYNSGTTASDALRMGVPLLTFPGTTFAGRMATSLLTALGLPGCIAADRNSLVELAVRLGNDAAARGDLRARLATLLPAARLFDPDAMAVDLEQLYRAMHANALAGRHATIRL